MVLAQHQPSRRAVLVCAGVAVAGLTASLIPLASDAAMTNRARPALYRTATPGPASLPASAVSQWPNRIVLGKTVRGRVIEAYRQGNPTSEKILLAVGVIHGNEPKGAEVVDRLRSLSIAADADYQIWTIRTMNPDGMARNRRYNGRRVDLNRNFPYNWSRWTLAAGRAPGSEAETQTLVNFIARLRPDATMIFHQDWNQILGTCNYKTRNYAYRFAALTRIPPEPCARAYTGTMGSWQNTMFPGYALTVELPPSRRIGATNIKRYANALVRSADELTNLDSASVLPAGSPTPTPPED